MPLFKSSKLSRSALYALVNEHLDHIILTVQTQTTSLLSSRTFNPKIARQFNRQPILSISSGCQLFHPISTLILEYITHYQADATQHPALLAFALEFKALCAEWARLVRAQEVEDALCDLGEGERNHFLGRVQSHVERMVGSVERAMVGVRYAEDEKTGATGTVVAPVPSAGVLAYLDK